MSLLIPFMFRFGQVLNSGIDFFVAFWLDQTENQNHFGFEWKKILAPQIFLITYLCLSHSDFSVISSLIIILLCEIFHKRFEQVS
jgi:hypothetical protein